MEDTRKMRAPTSYGPGFGKTGPAFAHRGHASANAPHYPQHQHHNIHPSASYENGIGQLTGSFNAFNLGNSKPEAMMPHNGHQVPADYSHPNGISSMMPGSQAYLLNGQLVWNHAPSSTNPVSGHTTNGVSTAPGMYLPGPYMPQPGYNWPSAYVDGANHSQAWQNPRVPSGSTDVPSLVTPRRDSDSTNERDGPGTPFNAFTPYGNATVTVVGHSPDTALTWTPSPAQQGYAAKMNRHAAAAPQIPPDLQVLLSQEPSIPQAVPAPYSPTKPLDRALENPNGNTNVYIRGLQPDTTDEMLVNYAKRFGDISSSKAIIDHATGLCKGFGFVKYYNYPDAERCIRGFFYRGYESSFARESFYAQLKKLHDDATTNLYVSNLPKAMNEHELAQFFEGYKVCSARILRTADGTGRGVGFARFEDREACEEIIRKYNNTPIGVQMENGEEQLIQIRYADTPEQKALKQQTTAARQYRTAEYESQTRLRTTAATSRPIVSSNVMQPEFEAYMTHNTGPSHRSNPSYSALARRNGGTAQSAPANTPVKAITSPSSIPGKPIIVSGKENEAPLVDVKTQESS